MNVRKLCLAFLLLTLLLLSGASRSAASAQISHRNVIQPASATGGDYLLSGFVAQGQRQSSTWQIAGPASGGSYRLQPGSRLTAPADKLVASGGGYQLGIPAVPTSSENGCCCLYLPCVRR